jgi:hypothetical protein
MADIYTVLMGVTVTMAVLVLVGMVLMMHLLLLGLVMRRCATLPA